MKNPFLKFYTSDWRADPALRMCSLAARGLWIEMICLMHEATPYGQLLVNGQSVTDAQLASLVGTTPEQITELLGELEAAGVFSKTRRGGVIYSRKMMKMEKKAAIARNNGRKGGNPTLSNQTKKQPSVNQKDKGEDKPQKPEARNQSIEIDDDNARAHVHGQSTLRQDATLRERVLHAMQVLDPTSGIISPNGKAIGSQSDWEEYGRWRMDLSLTNDEILNVISDVMRSKRDGPPFKFSYFTRAMRELSGQKSKPKLTPIEGGIKDERTHDNNRLQRIITAAARGSSGQDWG